MKFSHALIGAVLAFACIVAVTVDASAATHVPYFADVTLASMLVSPAALRARGIVSGVRADATDPKALFEALNKAFEEFKSNNDKQISDLRKDVVQSEKVDRINTSIDAITKAIDEANAKIAALTVGGAGDDKSNADVKAHKKGFDGYFRKGTDAGLRDLEVKAALTTDKDSDGGYLVSPEYETSIDRVLGTMSALRSIASVRTISSDELKLLVNLAGTGYGWVGERQSRTETDTPTLAQIAIAAMELYANPASTQKELDDARLDIGAWLADEVSIVFAEQEGAAFISGNGINKPRGLLGYTPAADASYAWGNPGYIATAGASDFAAEDPADALIDLQMALKQGYQANAVFLMNRVVQGKVRKLKDDQDNYLWQPGIQLGQPSSLLGKPIVTDDNMPNVGANTFPVAYGDFKRAYQIVDRFGIRVLRDPFTNKPYVHFYTTKRVGGGVKNFEAYKLLKCAVS